MNPLTVKSAIGYLAAVFLAGAVAGGTGGYYFGVRKAMTPPGPREFTTAMCDRFKSKLHLSQDQMEHIQPIIKDAVSEFRGVCLGMVDKMSEIAQRMNQRIAAFLNPEQKVLLQEMDRERQAFFDKIRQAGEDKDESHSHSP